MAKDFVDLSRFEAGKRYIDALEKLGFSVDYALWTVPTDTDVTDDTQLSIVSHIIETVGSKTVYELLFKAYERAGTPPDIDPWIVSLYGSNTAFGRHVTTIHEVEEEAYLTIMTEHGPQKQAVPTWINIVDRFTKPRWIYKLAHFDNKPGDDWWAFERFRRNVEALAA